MMSPELTITSDLPVVAWLDTLLIDSVQQGASDIHLEPYEKNYRVRIRLDGLLKEVANLPVSAATRVTARVKVLSQLDISERRLPQDGRFNMTLPGAQAIDFRVSTCPTLFGEKVVIRILNPNCLILNLKTLGYEPHQERSFLEGIQKSQGLVLVTGPTGSGKTMSLYTALNLLNTPAVNISTAEDPVEIQMPGLNQVPIQPKIGLDFATILQAFLRQDPDIMMVGEIRDIETAETAVKAAQTGHLVLSTLHTNSAAQTLTRLMNMGISAFNIATSVVLIVAQRLVRRLCPYCQKAAEPVGCDRCDKGYKGRIGIYEVVPMTPDLARLIISGGHALDMEDEIRRTGIDLLYESGMLKVQQGITSVEEILRVTQ